MEEMREACYRYKYYFIKKETLCSAKWHGFKYEDTFSWLVQKGRVEEGGDKENKRGLLQV
jgi:hypothetical protein